MLTPKSQLAPCLYPGNFNPSIERLVALMNAERPEEGLSEFLAHRPERAELFAATVSMLRFCDYHRAVEALAWAIDRTIRTGEFYALDARVAYEAAGAAGLTDTVRQMLTHDGCKDTSALVTSRIRACLAAGLYDEAHRQLDLNALPDSWKRLFRGNVLLLEGHTLESANLLRPVVRFSFEASLLYAEAARTQAKESIQRELREVLSRVPRTYCDRFLIQGRIAGGWMGRVSARTQYVKWTMRMYIALKGLIEELQQI